jgi:hypothetical protein
MENLLIYVVIVFSLASMVFSLWTIVADKNEDADEE